VIEIAVVLLKLPTGQYVFQRRSKNAPTSPNLAGLFGGHLEEGESPQQAVKRELVEETSLDVKKISLEKLSDKIIHYADGPSRHFYYFRGYIDASEFEVYEGDGAEVYNLDEARKRKDMTISTQHILKELADNG
jgi:8-oxo-dGTP pyrophosphatase MutT (NUDIX family)